MTQEEMLSQMNSMLQPLQQVNASQAETIIRLTRQNESLQNRLNELTAQVAWLNRQLFGHKSEKLPSLDSNQPDLFGDFLPDNAAELEKAREVAVQTITKETVESKKRERNNRRIMEGLPVLERVIIEPEDTLPALSQICVPSGSRLVCRAKLVRTVRLSKRSYTALRAMRKRRFGFQTPEAFRFDNRNAASRNNRLSKPERR